MADKSMLEALKRRKGNGLDLTIILGGPNGPMEGMQNGLMGEEMEEGEENEENEEKKEGDVAPDATQLGEHEDEEQDKSLIREELKKAAYGKLPLFGKKSG